MSKKNKYNTSIDEYISNLSLHCDKNKKISKSVLKISDDNIVLPTIQTYDIVLKYNYNINQLKIFAKQYKLKSSGNKKELTDRIYNFLYLSFYITKIQKIFRGFIAKKYITLHGPAYQNRKLCTNNCDFVTMELLEDISLEQFISYKDIDGFIYGFDIGSLYNMITKHQDIKNPYNRNDMPPFVFQNIKNMIRLSKLLNINVNLAFEDDTKNVSNEKNIELRALSLFQHIDSLGNYSNPQWFLSLTKIQLIKFMRELIDIWDYRAQLSLEVKYNICPPTGDPFRSINIYYLQSEQNINSIRNIMLEVLEKVVHSGIDRDSKSLGAYYVLGALTLVNNSAANALPWLFQSVNYF